MKVGFIGAGRMAQRRFVNLPEGCEPVAVFDKPGARVDRHVATRLEELHASSPEAVIDASDLVIIATPHVYLNDYAWTAHQYGRRIFVEKPGGIPSDGPLPPCRVGYNHRFWPGIQKARSEITGDILHIRAVYGHGNADRLWRMDPALSGGGELLDQGSHLIDLCHYLTGRLPRVEHVFKGYGGWQAPVEDTAFVLLSFGHVPAQLSASWCEWSPVFRLEIVTANEKIVVDGLPWVRQDCSVINQDGSFRSYDFWSSDRSLRLELEDALADGPDGATDADAQLILGLL